MSCPHDSLYHLHHLIYREELKKDGEKKVLCSGCSKPIWGFLHNCIECGNRPVHRNPFSKNHCLDFTEKLENDGNKQVVCSGCDEPVLGPAYKCSVSECSFIIHKSCAELYQEINHPLHPDHNLSLRFGHNQCCDACCRSHDRSFFYYCGSCDFQLDIKCANRLPNNPNDCHEYYCEEHHLIYREELKKDGEKKVLCSWRLCQEPIWGSLHNCIECGNRPVHRNPSSKNHCLDFTEKLENDGNKQVACFMCNEPVLGPAYKCSVSECSFVIHKSCAELSQEINHPLHTGHTLSLRWRLSECCDACCRSHDRSFFYYCRPCNFKLDIKCASRLPINPNDCHQHEFSVIRKRIQYNCEACGEELGTNLDYRECSICKLLVHKRCAAIPRIVKIKLHNHFLNLIYSLPEIKKHDDMFCKICGNKVNTEYAAYFCQECNYILHTECLSCFRDEYTELPTTSESVPNKSVGHATHLIKALNQAEDEGPHLGEIQHFSHQQHKLILCNDEVKDDKLCEGCMEFIISIPFYSCAQCKFFLHTRCAELPTSIEQHRLHYFHTLTLLPLAPNKSGVSFCCICCRHHRGFTYKCVYPNCMGGILTCDVQCGSIPETLKHEGHQHLFYLALNSKNRECKACAKDNTEYVFVCTGCDFILGIRCANLPPEAKHKYDTHRLKLTYTTKDDYEECYCLICEKDRDPKHWFYYCEKCNFFAHPECVIGNYPSMTIGSIYTSEYHPHPFTFVQKTEDSTECYACEEDLDDVALECSECKLTVHPPRPYRPDCLWLLSVVCESESESELE